MVLPPCVEIELPNVNSYEGSLFYDMDRDELVRKISEIQDEGVTALDLSGAELGTLYKEVTDLDWLTELNLRSNALSVLPAEIGNLQNLRRLNLSGNNLEQLPAEIGNLTKLR